MQNYLDLHRHPVVRTKLLQHQGIALRLAIAQIIAGSNLIGADVEPQKANTDKIAESLKLNKVQDLFEQNARRSNRHPHLAFVIAKTLPARTAMVKVPGEHLNVDMANHRKADDIFFKLLKDKEAINAMLAEVGGKMVAEGNGYSNR